MSDQPLLSEGFSALEPFVAAWALETPAPRLLQRMQSTMSEIEDFYRAMLRHLASALNYLDDFKRGQLPPPQHRLYWPTLAAAEAAPAIEIYDALRLSLAPEVSRFKFSYTNMDD